MTAAEILVKELHILALIHTNMVRQVIKEAPFEACGMLGGTRSGDVLRAERLYPTRNQLKSRVKYQINPVDQLKVFNDLEKKGLELVAIYHSHPAGPAYPSELDVERAFYPEAVQLIWFPGWLSNSIKKEEPTADWACRGFIIEKGRIGEINLRVSEQTQSQTS